MKEEQKQLFHPIVVAVTSIAALFILALGGLLLWNQARGKVPMLVNSVELKNLHEELRHHPKDEALKLQIRRLDFQLRQALFARLQLSRNATRALAVGVFIFLVGAHFSRVTRLQRPAPRRRPRHTHESETRKHRIASLVLLGVFAGVAIAALLLSRNPVQLPPRGAATPTAVAVPDFPTPEEIRQNWPSFRGPNGAGIAKTANIPLTWDAKTGQNIRWKTAIPLHGMSSPIIWGNRVFLTGANAQSNCVFSFAADTGQLLWTSNITIPGGVRAPAPRLGDDTSLAAPTPVTDGRRIYAIFPNGEIAAFDFAGKQIWARNIGPLENSYGYAASLAIYQDYLFIQIDRGAPEDGQSKMLALDTQTGQERWEKPRAVNGSWSSPTMIEVNGQPQLLTAAAPLLIAYNPLDGTELWQLKCLESDVAPTPIFAAGMVVTIAPNTAIYGVRPGAANFAWKIEDGVPEATSPISDGQRAYIISNEGLLNCCDLQTGKRIWQHEIEGQFYASPSIAGNALIVLDRAGTAHVLALGDKFEERGQGSIGEECGASPVPHGNRLYLRGKEHLFCIEAAQK
ncbi:MAG: hypothetical protein EPN23_09845 [Verrucomicrobia bacterium]|nr:MAG: hypothetical protein EPN23_09845 [Verrucomicrobiota bacterium]